MYLEHFKLKCAPFSLTPNTSFYCELPTHKEALNVLRLCLADGEGFIKIIGEVGTGKTLLCRLLLNELGNDYVTAYIPNPDLDADGLRVAVAKEIGVDVNHDVCQHSLIDSINQRLLTLHQQGRFVVLLIDEAQALSEQCLEAVRLLTNLETEEKKLLQVVLFGQPELDIKLNANNLRQLKQRITFSYTLAPLKERELDAYLCHRLAKAGYTYGVMFSKRAKKRLFKASGGLPRLVNILCHKAMLVAYGKGASQVDKHAILRAIRDTEGIKPADTKGHAVHNAFLVGFSVMTIGLILYIYWKLGIFS